VKYLLDTQIWLWLALEPQRLRREVADCLADPGNELWLSPVSVWEVLLLAEKGRIEIGEPAAWIRKALGGQRFREARLSHEIALASRLLHGLTLITSDQHLIACPAVPTLSNRS
jgi:PIN domain nuclease of toxin-antitoxin system